jgi:hypothetical protein
VTSVPTERRSDRGWGHDLDVVVQIAQSFEFEPRLVSPSAGSHRERRSRVRFRPRRFSLVCVSGVFGALGRYVGIFIDAQRTALLVVSASGVAALAVAPAAALPVSAAVVLMARFAGRVWAMVLGATLAAIGAHALVGVVGERAPIVLGIGLWIARGLIVGITMLTERINHRRSEPRWAPAWVEGPRRVPIPVLQHETPWTEIHAARKI